MDTEDASALLEQHRRLTSRLARRIGRSDAEDLASEAVARGLGRPAPDGRQAPWIERIFRNLVIDRHRRAGRARRTEAQSADVLGTCSPAAAATAEECLLEREWRGAVAAAIPSIPFPLRDALIARFYEDRDYDDVAATRGITPATARTRVHRALARLRPALARLRGFVPVPPPFGVHSLAAALTPAVLSVVVIPCLVFSPSTATIAQPDRILVAQVHATRSRPGQRPPEATSSKPLPLPAAATAATRPAPSGHAAARPAPSTDEAPSTVTRFSYDDDEVVGDLKRPTIEVVVGDPGSSKQSSLIEIPKSFEPAITKMLEDI